MGKVYNPFKLLGTYIGLVVGFVLAGLSILSLSSLCGSLGECNQTVLLLPILQVVLGFIIGWIVHMFLANMGDAVKNKVR